MELKELYKSILTSFDAEDVADFSKIVFDCLMSGKIEAFEKYLPLCPDFETDYLQKIWQFYEADRNEKKQDYTPACLGELLSALLGDAEGIIYDCCAGSGALTIQRWLNNKNSKFICEELDERVIPFLLFNLAVRNIEGFVIHGNALEQKRFKLFELQKGEKYSSIKEIDRCEISAYFGISNPPYNISWTPPEGILFDERFSELGMPPKNNANYAFILHVLSKIKNKAAFILPIGVLNEKSGIRKTLLEKGLISAVILLPDRMFESTSIGTCIILFDKSIKNEYVTFVDCRNFYATEIREQRGEDDVHYQRVYQKEINVLTKEHIKKIVFVIAGKNKELEFCISVPVLQILENDSDLTPGKYIQMVERKELHRPYKEIANDINRCRKDKNKLKLTINETLARNLGLMDIAEDVKNGNKLTDEMNNQIIYKNMGIEFEKEQYLTLTKNKSEIKLEQMDKEELSHLLVMLLPQFQQHIYYLNNRENEYLAELRDAMLPGLMDGSLSIN
ncbi:MAG: SAM-dependent methyltransferase [Treponema sp.]|nr:SAM-dependent methyltransferase [Treponema sp.]